MTGLHPENIPTELKDQPQWICWREEDRDGKPTKIPVNPQTGGMADSTDPDTWTEWDAALAAHESTDFKTDGVGFVFDIDGMYAGVDLDDCVDEDGGIEDWAREIVEKLDSYTEYSPSGTGLHVIVQGIIPPGGNRKGDVEMYDSERFFTFTGDVGMGEPNPIRQRVNELKDVHTEHIKDDEPDETSAPPEPSDVDLDDDELLEKARNAENGDRFQALWNGRTDDYPSQSEADLALCSHLAFWTGGDRHRIDHLFRQSGLMREKWKRDDYKERTINKALSGQSDYYDPTEQTALPNGGEPIPNGGTAPNGGTSTTEGEGGGTEPESPDSPDRVNPWDSVITLFDSNEKGTTTKGYNVAAGILTEEHDFVTIRESEAIYYYNPGLGYWVRKGGTFIHELLVENIPKHVNSARARNIRELVRDRTYINNDEFQPPEGKVNVRNGVLDLQTRELEPHSPEYYFTSALQTDYNPDADDDGLFDKLLDDVVDKESERKKLMEFVGYCMEMWHHDREKNLFIVGPSKTGKSTFQEVVEELFGGPPTVTNLEPTQIADTQFDAAALREAALNTVNDINASKIEDTGKLKRVFSGERMKMENKYEDRQFAAPKAKHLFTANWFPTVIGEDDAFYRRLLIIEFMKTVDQEDIDRSYKKQFKQDDVLQVMLNRALDARDRLRDQDHFTNDRSIEDTRKKWDSWQDAHKRFLYTQFEVTGDSSDTVDKEAYYQAYQEYAARKGFEQKAKQGVTSSLQWVPGLTATGESDDYKGLRWRKDVDAGEEDTHVTFDAEEDRRNQLIRRWVEKFATPLDPEVFIDDILEHAENQGHDREEIITGINNLVGSGELDKVGDDKVRFSPR